jgi:hypothetical protein
VYALPARPGTAVQPLREVGRVQFQLTGTPGGPNRIGQLTATSAAFSADGTALAVRTYTDAYLWRVHDGDVAAALRAPPVRVALPAQPQGEGIAVDGQRLLIDSEGVHSAVYAVPLPALPPVKTSPTRTASPSSSPRPASTPDADRQDRDPFPIGWVAAGLAAMAALVVGLRRLVRRRH